MSGPALPMTANLEVPWIRGCDGVNSGTCGALFITRRAVSARKSTRLTQLHRISKSHRAMTVRVLPAPVAITTKAFRWCSFSNVSEMRRMARVW